MVLVSTFKFYYEKRTRKGNETFLLLVEMKEKERRRNQRKGMECKKSKS